MAIRLSTALANHLLQNGSLRNALDGGKIEIYSGAQPATADAAVTGTLLCTVTLASGAHTDEVVASGNITLTGGAAGSVNTVTVNGVNIIPNGAVPFNTSINQTASDLAAAINAQQTSPEYVAAAVGAVITISAMRGTGTTPNGFVVADTLTTITATTGNMAGGVAYANGLSLGNASGGVIAKTATETWTGVAVVTGTAGWARFKAATADAGLADATASMIRIDGSCATSGAQFNLTSTAFVAGATQTVSSFSVTQPTA